MRKILVAIVALLMLTPLALRSQNVMTVHLKTGEVVDLAFKFQPVITFTDHNGQRRAFCRKVSSCGSYQVHILYKGLE